MISDTTVVGFVKVGTDPKLATYDDRNGYVYVPNAGSDNLSVLSGTTVVGSVEVGSEPGFASWDSRNGYVYVPNSNDDNVSVVSGTKVVGSVNVGSYPSGASVRPGQRLRLRNELRLRHSERDQWNQPGR